MIGNISNMVQKKEDDSKSEPTKPALPEIDDRLVEVHEKTEKSSSNSSKEKVSIPNIKITQVEDNKKK